MTIVGKLGRDIGLGTDYIAEVSVAGPALYAAGGFTVDTLLRTVSRFLCNVRDGRIGGTAADTRRTSRYTEAAGVITIIVEEQTGAGAWAEVADATVLSGETWDVIAVGTP